MPNEASKHERIQLSNDDIGRIETVFWNNLKGKEKLTHEDFEDLRILSVLNRAIKRRRKAAAAPVTV